MHQRNHGLRLVVLPNAQVLQPAELFLVGEGAGDEAVVDAHRAFGLDGQKQRFAHERVLEVRAGRRGGEVVVEPRGGGDAGGGGVGGARVEAQVGGDAEDDFGGVAPDGVGDHLFVVGDWGGRKRGLGLVLGFWGEREMGGGEGHLRSCWRRTERSSLRAQMLVTKRFSPVESFWRFVTTLTLQSETASTIRNSPCLPSSG